MFRAPHKKFKYTDLDIQQCLERNSQKNDILWQVVTEKTPWDGGMVGVNSFGFGGANCHVLLKWNEKQKKNGGLPDDDIPRVVPASGRTEEAVDAILSDVSVFQSP